MTDSGTSSPSTVPSISLRETPPHSPRIPSSHSSSPSISASPLEPLPSEVFSLVLSFLEPSDLERCLLVSRSWHAYIDVEPSLWGSLDAYLDADDQRRVDRICRRADVNGRRTVGGIRVLRLHLRSRLANGRPVAYNDSDQVQNRLVEILLAVFKSSVLSSSTDHPPDPKRTVYSSLTTLDLRLAPNDHVPACILHKLAELATNPLFDNLKHFIVHMNLTRFKIREHVLCIFPGLSSLTIAAVSTKSPGVIEPSLGPWEWQPHPKALPLLSGSLAQLHCLDLRDVRISDLILPDFPRLKQLRLRQITWEGRSLFLLLRLARSSLETLYCVDLVFEPADDEFEDWKDNVDIRNPELVDGHIFPDDQGVDNFPGPDYQPPPIILSSLHTLHLTGHTPPIFVNFDGFEHTPESEPLPTPILVMPALHTAILDNVAVEPENGPLDEAMSPLVTLGRSAPQLRCLDIRNTMTGDTALQCCLNAINGSIHQLDVSATLVTDHLIVRLPDLAPQLKTVDVRECVNITCQGVARAVEVIRMRNDEGLTKVEGVYVSPPEEDANPACWQAYKWLDFVGVLWRHEWDFEGEGPNGTARGKWIKQGKEDAAKEHKAAYAKWEKEELEKRRRELAALLAAQDAAAATTTGASPSGTAHSFSPHSLQQLSAVQQQWQQSTPTFSQQPHAPLPARIIPPLPMTLPQPQQQTYSTTAGISTVPLPFPPDPQPVQDALNVPVPSLLRLAPQQQVPAQEHYQPHPPVSPLPRVRSAASDSFDISCLDSLESFDQLDPAFLAEQLKAMEQAQERNSQRKNAESAAAVTIERSREDDVAAAKRAVNVQRAKEQHDIERTVKAGTAAMAHRTPVELAQLSAIRAHQVLSPRASSARSGSAGTPMQISPRVVTPTSTLTASAAMSSKESLCQADERVDLSLMTANEALVRGQLDKDDSDEEHNVGEVKEVILDLGFADGSDEEEVVAEVTLEKVV
ncbi:hypothetical protein JCM11251_002617 [Rhodosporidiobolus azoricus]